MLESWTRYLGISGKSGGHPDWVGRVGVDLQGVGLNVDPRVGSQPWLQSPKCLMDDVVYYCSVHHGKQMAPGEMDPLPVSPSSAGGQTLEETAT